jgi:histidyl-tRNA synthetase
MSRAKDFARLPGFRDFPPEELALRSHIFSAWRRVSRRYGFLEYDAPPLEPLDLYVEKSGEEIVGQLYNFTDKGDREVSLRPEMTPSLARVLGERSRAMPKPIRWFSIPQLFRYERQQRGRLREHFQWNVDLLGADAVEADAEILAVALDGLRELGLGRKDIRARVSDRRLLAALLTSLGVPDGSLLATYAVVDKIEREPEDRIRELLTEQVGLEDGAVDGIIHLFQNPDLDEVSRRFSEDEEVARHLDQMREFLQVMDELGLSDYVDFDLTIVRGLAYYTGIVFEVFDRKGEFRAICGGGRYDRLLELVGGEPLPAVGFGMGDVVLTDLLQERGLAPEYGREVDHFIVVIGEDQAPLARRVARALRGKGRSVVYGIRGQSVRKQFSAAANEGAREVIILGPDEVQRERAVLRDMETGDETEVTLQSLMEGNPKEG